MAVLRLFLYSLLLIACSNAGDDPLAVTRNFYQAVSAGDEKRVLDFLSPETKDLLEAAASRANELSGGDKRFNAADMIATSSGAPSEKPRLSIKSQTDARVVVIVKREGQPPAELELVRANNRWRIDLSDSLAGQ